MDFNSDHSPAILNRGYSFASIPNYVRLADKPPVKIASIMWADPVRLEFPVDTASNTYKSAAYALADKGLTHPAWIRIKEASVYHDIEDDINALVEGMQAEVKSATVVEPDRFALVVSLDGEKSASETVGLYPLNDFEQVVESARCLMDDRENISIDCFKQACENVMLRAAELKIPGNLIHEEIRKQGVETELNEKLASFIIDLRCEAHPDDAPLYRELLATAMANPDQAKEAAVLVQELDDTCDYLPKYREPDPVTAFCVGGIPVDEIKKASEENVFFDGIAVPLTDLRRIDGEKLASYMNEKLASDIAYMCKSASSEEFNAMLDELPHTNARAILCAIGDCLSDS